jgi:ADP-heptose:LPS heptosyltransferase
MKPRLLVVELHHLGDAVMAVPFLRAAMEKTEVAVLCTPSVAGLLGELVPGVRTIEAESGWIGRIWQAVRIRRAFGPGVVVSAWADARVFVLGWLAGAQSRVGFPMTPENYYASGIDWRRRNLAIGRFIERVFASLGVRLVSEPIQRESASSSHLSNWVSLGRKLGWEIDLQTPWFAVPDGVLDGGLGEFLAVHRSAGRRVCFVHAGGRLPTKRWPVGNFQTLLETFFIEKGIAVVIVQSDGEEAPVPVGRWQMAWRTDSHAALAAALSLADFVLCNDSYPAHLAAAVGVPVAAIFGSGEPAWFAPYANERNVIRNPGCPFHPCIDRCRMPRVVCLQSVSPGDVAAVLGRLAG